MRHPFDGLNGGVTRRTALGMAAGAVATLLGVGGTARVRANGAFDEYLPEPLSPTTEPFGEEAGRVVSQAAPGLEDGGRPWQEGRIETLTRGLGEEGSVTHLVTVAPTSLALQGADLEKAWRNLGSADAAVGVQSCALLYGAKDGVKFLQTNLKPENLKILEADRRSVARWIDELDSGAFKVRQTAEKELEKASLSAVAAMKRALKSPKSLEQKRRLERLIEQAENDAPTTRGKRAVEVLVALRTPEAVKLLEGLAKGASSEWLTEAARDALDRARKPIPPPEPQIYLIGD